VFLRLLDRWDEKRARLGERAKAIESFALGTDAAFPFLEDSQSLGDFCKLAVSASADPSYYDLPPGYSPSYDLSGNRLQFQSALRTAIPENNTVTARITEGVSPQHALVVFHHWNASKHQDALARYFSRRGITIAELAMPYHFERSRPGAAHADYMLSANIGRTLQSVRQAVWDGRALIQWFSDRGYKRISVLGMSLGSWVAGLVAAHDPLVTRASLFLSADSLADMVWTGRATQAIRKGLETAVGIDDLRRAWAPMDLGHYVHRLARSDLGLHMVLANRDTVVMPDLTRRFVGRLQGDGAGPIVKEFSCGHYSLALPPFSLMAGLSLRHFLTEGG
jgi:hypothetical protein